MKHPPTRSVVHSKGSALLIVLALLLLLTTLTVAFLSRATFERQLSNASFNQGKVDLAGQGAIAAILGDLQTEIVAGSTGGTGTPTLASGYYYPNAPATVIPAIVGFTPAVGLEDLLKISFPSAFYSGANYNTSTYPAPNRASSVATTVSSLNGRSVTAVRWNKALLLAPTSSSYYAPSSSSFVVPNWIYVARDGSNPTNWDSSYEYIPSVAPTTAPATGTPGYNPVTQRYAYAIYDEGSTLDLNVAGCPVTGTSGTSVTYSANQPYKNALAYADLTQLPSAGPGTSPLSSYLSAAQQKAFVNAIVGWRNFASAGLTASNVFPNTYAFTAGTPGNAWYFDQNVIFNPSGFLSVAGYNANGNPSVSGSGLKKGKYDPGAANESDNAFASRQQLLQFFLLNLGQNTTFTGGGGSNLSLNNLVQLLPYLGTFSRDISQPSYAPCPVSSASNPNGRPVVVAQASGGNSLTTGGATGGDAIVNPPFLGVTATTAFTRNNGTTAVVGEPLVKKRFALSRLAWLTYLGASAGRTIPASSPGIGTTNNDMWLLTSNYGIPSSFLQQGTAINIYNYFGLTWLPVTANGATTNMWVYSHPGGYIAPNGSLPVTIAPLFGTGASINTLAQVQALGREPDFVELLKAAVCAGSIGKASSYGATSSYPTFAAQYNRDINIDFQVIQIAANIISQATTDNYPTQIYYVDATTTAGTYGSYSNVFHGIKNLPYVSQVRNGIIKAAPAAPWGAGYQYMGTGTATPYTNPYSNNPTFSSANGAPLTQTGLGLALQFPELWNPHDWNSSNLNQTIGSVQPTNFRIIAESNPTYGGFSQYAYNGINGAPGVTSLLATTGDTGGSSTWYAGQFTNGSTITNPTAYSLTAANTAMSFTIPATAVGASLFREPMVLFKPGSQISLVANTGPGSSGSATITSAITGLSSSYISGGGFLSAVTDPAMIGDSSGQVYIGFYEGAFPLRWISGTTVGTSATTGEQVNTLRSNQIKGIIAFKVSLQYQDPSNSSNWITYDEKYYGDIGFGDQILDQAQGPFLTGYERGEGYDGTIDPRTARFNMFRHFVFNTAGWNCFPPMTSSPPVGTGANPAPPYGAGGGWGVSGTSGYGQTGTTWVDSVNGVILTERPDFTSGSNMFNNGDMGQAWSFPIAAGWYPGESAFEVPNGSNDGPGIRPGLLSQNTISAPDDGLTTSFTTSSKPTNNTFYADPDGVVRRAMAGWVVPNTFHPATALLGLPLATANTISNAAATRQTQSSSRPVVLNRPFRSVAELGYVFSGTPWRNLSMSTPESGASALLDVFCINDTNDPNGLVAGKVNLNTRQYPVLQAILAGAYEDDWGSSAVILTGGSSGNAGPIASALVARTTNATVNGESPPSTAGPLANISELVGKWNSSAAAVTTAQSGAASPNNIDGSQSYIGFTGDGNLTTTLGGNNVIQRYRESVVRALSASTTTRVWNLMIDVIAQTGRFPSSAASLASFNVEGERRYWVHVAIDRYSGKVLDEQIEEVKE